MFADLSALVAIDSGTANVSGVNAVQDWLEERARAWGAAVERWAVDDTGDQLLARWPAGDPDQTPGPPDPATPYPRVLLCGHADTVYPEGAAALQPLSRDEDQPGRLRGPGAADMKGGLIAALYAVQALREGGRMPPAGVALAVVPDEERGSVRSEAWLRELAAGFDIALVMEPARANGDLVTGRKGGGFWTLEVTGRSAHAGIEPEKGASALIQMAHHALALDAIAPSIEGASLVLGTLQAGTAPNVVPERALMTIDARAFTPDALAELVRAIEASVAHTAGRVPGTASRLKGGVNKAPMPRAEPTVHLYQVAERAAAELGITIGECVTGGTSDANSFADAGLAVLDGLGPVGGAMHTPEEYIEARSLVERTALLAALVARVGNADQEV